MKKSIFVWCEKNKKEVYIAYSLFGMKMILDSLYWKVDLEIGDYDSWGGWLGRSVGRELGITEIG